MKIKKKILTSLLLIALIINLFPKIEVKAISDSFLHVPDGAYYYTDSSALPSGDIYFFYKWADGKAWYDTSFKGAIALCNKQGLIFKPEWIAANWSGADFLYTLWDSTQTGIHNLVFTDSTSAELNSGLSNCIGIAINDISGCTLDNHSGIGGTFEVDSWVNNIVHDYVEDLVSVIPPDFISFPTVTDNQFRSYNNYEDSTLSQQLNILNTYDDMRCCTFSTGSDTKVFLSTDDLSGYHQKQFYVYDSFNNYVFSPSQSTYFDNIVTLFGLSQENYVINISDVLAANTNNTLRNFSVKFYDKSTFASSSVSVDYYNYTSSTITLNSSDTTSSIYVSRGGNGYFQLLLSNLGWITIYKSVSTPSQIKDNLYKPNVLTSNTWNNYDSSSSSNNTNITTNQISNSTTTNTNIYNTTSTEINNNTTTNNYNYSYDNSSTVINNIVNNYYGDDDNGGGGGGGGDDSPVWDLLLEGIAEFFRKIGELLAAILLGIVNLFGEVLTAIATIVTDFTGITDFLSSVFSFLPSEMVSVLTLALTTGLLISLIRMIRK